jgi:hypothetical protein
MAKIRQHAMNATQISLLFNPPLQSLFHDCFYFLTAVL